VERRVQRIRRRMNRLHSAVSPSSLSAAAGFRFLRLYLAMCLLWPVRLNCPIVMLKPMAPSIFELVVYE
jgi:hypothetical protein